MIALYILLGILALLMLVLISSVTVLVHIDDDAEIKVGFWFLRFKVFPLKDKKVKKKANKSHKPKEDGYIKKLIEQNGIVGAVSELLSVVKIVLKKAGKAARHIRVRRCSFLITAASEDAATTAVRYGALCATVFPALKGLQDLLKWNDRKTKVSVVSDFNSDKPTIYLDLKVKLRLCFIVSAAFGVLLALIKRKVSKTLKSASDNTRLQKK